MLRNRAHETTHHFSKPYRTMSFADSEAPADSTSHTHTSWHPEAAAAISGVLRHCKRNPYHQHPTISTRPCERGVPQTNYLRGAATLFHTLSRASTSAHRLTSRRTQSIAPDLAAICSGVWLFCTSPISTRTCTC